MTVVVRSALVVIAISLGGTATAAPVVIATDPERPVVDPARSPQHPPAGIGGDVAFGWGGQKEGPRGWVLHLEYEVYPVFGQPAGGVFGFVPGIEVWRSGPDNWGFSLPVGIVGGLRIFPFRATAGFGFDAFLIDQVDDDTGVGFWAPFAMARVGVDVEGFQIGADARYGYRWQIGAADHARWSVALFVGKTWGTGRRDQPFY